MKCWIASFPRSGNTYFRNILYYVYGLESSTWHKESRYPVDKNYDRFDFVKTHLLPGEIEPNDPSIPAIYLVRDGRDALVSIAHHRSDIIQPGSDFSENLYEAIIANNGSYFGGWSVNVNEWLKRADIIIRFEDLIKEPERVFKRVEALIEMPEARWDRLPDFKELKFGRPKYGGQTTSKKINIPEGDFSKKFFRKGKSGSWKDDMSAGHLELFWHFHADVMDRLGYTGSPSGIPQNSLLDSAVMLKMAIQDENSTISTAHGKPARILIDGQILASTELPSARRNVIFFLKGLMDICNLGKPNFTFDVYTEGKIVPLQKAISQITATSKKNRKGSLHRLLITLKQTLHSVLPEKLYFGLAGLVRNVKSQNKAVHTQRKGGETTGANQNNERVENRVHHFDNYELLHIPILGAHSEIGNLFSKKVVTVHTLNEETGADAIVRNAEAVITPDRSISSQLQKRMGVKKNKLFTISQTPPKKLFYRRNRKGRVSRTLKKYAIYNASYFLCESYEGTSSDGFITIADGFRRFKKEYPSSEVKLLVFGGKHHFRNTAPKHIRTDRDILFTGHVEEHDLRTLYSNALALIQYKQGVESYFSRREARLCKAPVICSNESVPEELIDDGLLFDPIKEETIVEKMSLLYTNPELRSDLSEKFYKKTLEETLRTTLFETFNVYQQILGR